MDGYNALNLALALGREPIWVAALSVMLVLLPLMPPLRADVAYLFRKAYPGSIIRRAAGLQFGSQTGRLHCSVLDIAAVAGAAMLVIAAALEAEPAILAPGLGLVLLLLFTFDLRYRILPDTLTLPLALAGILSSEATGVNLWPSITGLAVTGLTMLALQAGFRWLRGYDGLGGGDVKLLAAMGAWLGPAGCPLAVAAAALAALASEAAFQLLVRGHIDRHRRIAFGAYICAAFWVVWCAGLRG